MMNTNTLNADVVIANVERYLAQQINMFDADAVIEDTERLLYEEYIFYKRRQAQAEKPKQQKKRDGLVIIAAWIVITFILLGGK